MSQLPPDEDAPPLAPVRVYTMRPRREDTFSMSLTIRPTTVESERLKAEARARNLSVGMLLTKVVANMCEDNLFRAVLEEG